MTRGFTGGKREREATRARRKREKVDRLRQNRERRPGSDDPGSTVGPDGQLIDGDLAPMEALPAVNLEDVVIGVAPRPRQDISAPVKLFIGSLSWETTTDDLKVAFSNFGKVVDVVVITDRNTGRSRGFGFVTYENRADAEEAIKQMNGKELDGRTLKVNRAEAP